MNGGSYGTDLQISNTKKSFSNSQGVSMMTVRMPWGCSYQRWRILVQVVTPNSSNENSTGTSMIVTKLGLANRL